MEVVPASASGANVTVTYSRRDRAGAPLSRYEALILATGRDGVWKVQAFSRFGT